MKLGMNLSEIMDLATRTALEQVERVFLGFVLGGFQVWRVNMKLSAPSYPATLKVGHSLGAVPTDVIQTYASGGTVTWNVDGFTSKQLSVTISAAVSVRGWVGYYRSDV